MQSLSRCGSIWLLPLLLCLTIAIASGSSTAIAANAIRVGVQLEPPNLDPTSGAAAAIDEIVYANIFEGLTRIDQQGSVQPALASHWDISDDGLHYRFFLHDNVTFHNGDAFSADDVVSSLRRAGAPDSTNAQRAIFELIKDVRAVDAHTVDITLAEPLGAFLSYLAWGDAVIVSEKTARTNAASPVGTGPFRFHQWRKGASIVLTRNETYWGNPAPLDQIEFHFISDPNAAFAALMAGDIDGFPNFSAIETLSFIERDQRFTIATGTSEGETILAMNNGKKPLDDLRVRQAINYAIDKEAIIHGALYGFGVPIGSHFPPHHKDYIDLTARYEYNPAKARELLGAAGLSDGLSLTLVLPPPSYARRSGEIIAAQLRNIGIDVIIQNIEWSQWLSDVFANKNYDLTIVSHTEPLDIDIYARSDYYFQYKNETFNAVIADLRRENDPATRKELHARAQTIIADDAVNVFLAQGAKVSVWRNGVAGVWVNAPVQANDLTQTSYSGRAISGPARTQPSPLPMRALIALTVSGLLLVSIFRFKVSPLRLMQRIGVSALTLLAASLIIFVAIEVLPGDPASFMMGLHADPQSVTALRTELGLDQPVFSRYFSWIAGMTMGDFGTSYTYRSDVADLILERLGVTLPLAVFAFAITVGIGIPAGAFAAANAKNIQGRAAMMTAQAGISLPNFWFGLLLVLTFSVWLRWFSAGGFPGWEAGFFASVKSLLLPALALGIPQAAILTQITRASMLETLGEDYIRTARAKGASRASVIINHALRNALLPVVTILGLQFAFLIAGSIIVENVFYLPGLGRLVFQAINQRDLIVVESAVMCLVFTVILVSLLVDIVYTMIDPRLRTEKATQP